VLAEVIEQEIPPAQRAALLLEVIRAFQRFVTTIDRLEARSPVAAAIVRGLARGFLASLRTQLGG